MIKNYIESLCFIQAVNPSFSFNMLVLLLFKCNFKAKQNKKKQDHRAVFSIDNNFFDYGVVTKILFIFPYHPQPKNSKIKNQKI